MPLLDWFWRFWRRITMPIRDTFEEPPKPEPEQPHVEPDIDSPETHEPPAGEPMDAPAVPATPPASMPPAGPQALSDEPPPWFEPTPHPVVPPILMPFPTKNA
jgi:hypothetical protein